MSRISPPAEYEKSVVEILIARGIFAHKYQVLTFAAALGYRSSQKAALSKKGEAIRLSVFQNHGEDLAVDVIGLASSKNLEEISNDKENRRAAVFEEYAHSGLILMQQECFESGDDAKAGMLRLIKRWLLDSDAGPEAVDKLW